MFTLAPPPVSLIKPIQQAANLSLLVTLLASPSQLPEGAARLPLGLF